MTTLLFAVLLQAVLTAAAPPGQQAPPPEPPQYEILTQEGAPLRIVSVKTKWSVPDRTGIEIYAIVENVGARAVSSYATRNVGGDEGEGGRHCLLISADSPGKALRPGGSEGRSTWTFVGAGTPAVLRRAVDWVEFTDGATWGEDTCKSAESLAARRAGAREARRLLREVFESGGADAVLETLRQRGPKVSPPDGHPDAWKTGFLRGVEGYAERIRRADQEWGYTEIEHALRRPIDALDEKSP
jgi:hypothetical protein